MTCSWSLALRVLGQGVAESHFCVSRETELDRKSTRLNSSHSQISYAVFCLKKKKHAIACVLASIWGGAPILPLASVVVVLLVYVCTPRLRSCGLWDGLGG